MKLQLKKVSLVTLFSAQQILLCSISGVDATVPENKCLVKEIVKVTIKGDRDLHGGPLFQKINLNNLDKEDEVVVSFRYGNNESRNSIELKEPGAWKSNDLLSGLVNDHIVIDPESPEHLFCEIIKKGKTLFGIPFLPKFKKDEVVATSEFTPDDLKLSGKECTIKTQLRAPDGSSSRNAHLEIDVIQKHWKDMYAHSNVTFVGKQELFFALTGMFFVRTMDASNNLNAWEFKKNVDAANPKLAMVQPLPEELPELCFPEKDEFAPVKRKVLLQFKILGLLSFQDTLTRYANRAEGIYDIRQNVGKYIPTPKEGRWVNPTSDASMKRVYFSSIGMFLVEKVPGLEQGYVADVTDISKYEIRENPERKYEPYGCKTYFDENGDIVKIEDLQGEIYTPSSPYWEWAKLKSRTAAFTKAAFIHLGSVHYCWGNLANNSLRMFLAPNHPLRRAFTPHFYKTHHTCKRAENSLFAETGVLFRGLALKYEGGLKQVFIDYIGGFKFGRYPDELEERGLTNCKFHVGANDGMDLHRILSQYVSDLIDETYASQEVLESDFDLRKVHEYLVKEMKISKEAEYTLDNVKTIWAEIIFRVTGYHNAGKKYDCMYLHLINFIFCKICNNKD